MTELEPGYYPDLSWDDYAAIDLPSQSVLKEGLKSMLHVWHALNQPRPPTDAMRLGSALHAAVLEKPIHAVWDRRTDSGRKAPRNGKAWNEFQRENADKILLTEKQGEDLAGMVAAVRRHPIMRTFPLVADVEASVIGNVHGLTCKGRADIAIHPRGADVKTGTSAGPDEFQRTVFAFGLHIQQAMYEILFGFEAFCFIVVESSPPYDCVVYTLAPDVVRYGHDQLHGLIDRYKRAVATGEWLGRSNDVEEIGLPRWLDYNNEPAIRAEEV